MAEVKVEEVQVLLEPVKVELGVVQNLNEEPRSTGTFEDALISAVGARPELYDPNNFFYRDRTRKNLAWMRVAEEVGQPEDMCRKKWRSLRDTYLKERRKETDKKSGSAAGDTKKWRFYNAISFLEAFVTLRPTTSSLSPVEEETAENLLAPTQDQEAPEAPETEAAESIEQVEPSPSQAPAPAPLTVRPPSPVAAPKPKGGKRKRLRPSEEPTAMEQAILVALKNRPAPTQQFSPIEYWLLSLAPSLEKLPFYDQELLKMKINKLVFEHCTAVLNLAPVPAE